VLTSWCAGAGPRRLVRTGTGARCLTCSKRSADAASRSRHLAEASGLVACATADQELVGVRRVYAAQPNASTA
jgi:hypothetical protein